MKTHRHSAMSTRDCPDCESLRRKAYEFAMTLPPLIVTGDRVTRRDRPEWRGTVVKIDLDAHLAEVMWNGDSKPTTEHTPALLRVAPPPF